jgi:hypothetical protein
LDSHSGGGEVDRASSIIVRHPMHWAGRLPGVSAAGNTGPSVLDGPYCPVLADQIAIIRCRPGRPVGGDAPEAISVQVLATSQREACRLCHTSVIELGGEPMTVLLHAIDLQRIAVNPFADEPQHRAPVLCWTIDPTTLRPIASWRLEPKSRSPELSQPSYGVQPNGD